ncbi:MAG: ABC transporter ATP-binding protein/permease [Clostridiales bacterium]|nr:ABC transporter ATP-binding protein/permease [Clostridiales bacterium]
MPGPGDNQKHGYVKPKNAKKTFGRILKYMGKSKIFLSVVFLTLILSTVCQIGASYWLKPILNDIEASIKAGNFMSEGIKTLVKNLVIAAVLYICTAVFTYIQSRVMVTIAYKTTNLIRKELFNHMQSLPLRYFDSNTHGEIMSRFTNDVDNIQMMLEQSMVQLVSSAFTFAGIIIMMIVLSPPLFAIAFVFLIIMVITVTQIGKQSKKYFRLQQKTLGAMNGTIEETIEGLKVVKVFNHEEEAISEFTESNDKFRKAATNANFYAGVMGPGSMGINNASYATIALTGGILTLTTGLDIGTFFTFLSYAKQFTQPINQIANQMNTVFSALAGAERVFEVMDMESEVDDGTVTITEKDEGAERNRFWNDSGKLTPVMGNVEFKNVNFGYIPEKTVLKNINLYAKPGQKIAFVGSTGAGKTTITNLINRFYDIQDGVITYDGIDVKRIKKDDLRKSLSIVLQDTHMFTGTVMDNIRYGRLDASDEECIAAAKLASAHSFIRRLPDGYNTVISGDGENLSQGQRQLLAIARAETAKPVVLILDEATSSVDTRTELHIEHGMDRLMQGRTVFVIAHRLSTVRNADAIMVLENGEIIERGSHNDLIALKGRYYELCTGKAKLS